jgi:hypothetical protein
MTWFRDIWAWLQGLRWYFRWPIKWSAVGLALFLVCYPNPAVLARHIRHSQNPNAMIEADSPDLQPWVSEVRERLDPAMQPRKALQVIQRFVYEKVPYKYDWETWGCADYLPTLSEVMELGYEDCDGQAVVAASLLRNLGYKAELVSDGMHVWVKTDKGDTMSPGKKRSVVATDRGVQVQWAELLKSAPRAAAVGIALFPATREMIVAAVLWLVLLRPGVKWWVRLLCLLILVDGLLILRAGGANWVNPNTALQWWGFVQMVGSAVAMIIVGRRAARPVAMPAEVG